MSLASLMSWLIARMAGLPPARRAPVAVERDLRAPMPDGVALLADRYSTPGDERAPIVLVRTPYGRGAIVGVVARALAGRGFQVVVQSVRGTFGSEGVFEPLRHEREDGLATLAWLAEQSWFGGSVGMMGASYLGFTQWAVAAEAPSFLKALAMQVTASNFRDPLYDGESFGLKTALSGVYLIHHQEGTFWQVARANARSERALAPGYAALPLAMADETATGKPAKVFQDWLASNAPGAAYWEEIGYSQRIPDVAAPVSMTGGWYDIFLPYQLRDYAAMRRAGKAPRLTIGPWRHTSYGLLLASVRESLLWFEAHLRGAEPPDGPPVRLYVMGANQWRTLPEWPPPATPARWNLQPAGLLDPADPPVDAPPDHYRYDPADPTPTVGGAVLTSDGGAKDNRPVEARADTLTYTSAPLAADLEVIGPVEVELYARSSLEHTDFFARLCDVAPGGRSINVCDGLARLRPGSVAPDAGGVMRVRIALWPTAYRFRAGRRLRVQIASGAFPRYARNLGGGEELATATRFHIAEQDIYHDAARPSAITLPVNTSA